MLANLGNTSSFFGDLSKLRGGPRSVAAILATYRAKVKRINDDPRLSAQAKRDDVEAALKEALLALAGIESTTTVALDSLRAKVKAALTVKLDPQEALAAELRQGRAWERAKTLLAAKVEPFTVIQRAADAGDRDSLLALAAELPTWLEAAGYPQSYISEATAAIRTAERPMLDSKQALARDIEAELAKGLPQLQAAINFGRYDLTGGPGGDRPRSTVSVIPAWEHRETIDVSEGEAA